MYVNIVKTVPSITMEQLKIFEYAEQTFHEVQERAEELLDYGNSREKMQGVGMLEAIAHIKQTLDSPISSIL